MENLVTITVNSTHFYLIDTAGGKLLFDVGWLNLLPQFLNRLKTYKIGLSEIKFIVFSHTHPDHADLVQTIKRLSGARLLIHAIQIPFLAALAAFYQDNPAYEAVVMGPNDLVSPDRAKLHALGIRGEIIETPGHSDDSISLVLDSGMAFIGDLLPPQMAGEENLEVTRQSWARLIEHGVQTIYPAHADPFLIERVKQNPP